MFFKVEGITKNYGGLVANNNISIDIEQGQIVSLIGPNGAGKSTLFQTVQGFVKANSGTIALNDKDITGLPPDKICQRGIACTFQHAQLFPKLSVLESVMVGAYSRTNSRKDAEKFALEIITSLGLKGKEEKRIGKLNMFDRKCVELSAALATRPKLLLLDELFAGLNPSEVEAMTRMVQQVREQYDITLFIIEHVLKVIMSISDIVYVLDYGEIIAKGTPAEVTQSEAVIKAYLGEDYDAS